MKVYFRLGFSFSLFTLEFFQNHMMKDEVCLWITLIYELQSLLLNDVLNLIT